MTTVCVVVAAHNEAENLEVLLPELESVLSSAKYDFQVIVVDDGSSDGTQAVLAKWETKGNVKVIRHPARLGKSAAWRSAFEKADAEYVCTLDGDLQDNPADLPAMIDLLQSGKFDFVSGYRSRRSSPLLHKTIPSRIGNFMLRWFVGTGIRDHGSGIKAMRSEVSSKLAVQDGFHRVLPLLAEQTGFRVGEVKVDNRRRLFGDSKFGFERFWQFGVTLLKMIAARPGGGESKQGFSDRAYFIALYFTLLAALLLRLFMIGSHSLWGDEDLSLHYAGMPYSEIPSALAEKSVHPPLYFLILRFWMGMAGDSDAALRFLSILFGLATIPALAAITARQIDRRTAVIAAILLAISPFHIYFSQEVRPYALMGLFLALSFWAFYKICGEWSRRNALWYFSSKILLLYTHVYGLCALLTHNIHYVLFYRRHSATLTLRRWGVLQAAIAVSFIPWVGSFMLQAREDHRFNWIKAPTAGFLWEHLNSYSDGYSPLTWVLAVFCLISILAALGSAKIRREAFPLSLWMAAPWAAGIIASYIYRPVLYPRYTVQSFLFLLVLAAWGMRLIGRRFFRGLFVASAVAAVSVPALITYYGKPQRSQWREGFEYIALNSTPSDLLLNPYFKIIRERYLDKRFPDKRLQIITGDQLYLCVTQGRDECKPGTRLWIIEIAYSASKQKTVETLKTIGFEPVKTPEEILRFADVEVRLLVRTK